MELTFENVFYLEDDGPYTVVDWLDWLAIMELLNGSPAIED